VPAGGRAGGQTAETRPEEGLRLGARPRGRPGTAGEAGRTEGCSGRPVQGGGMLGPRRVPPPLMCRENRFLGTDGLLRALALLPCFFFPT
jgi:hypothetical protein